jgi:hypothetical protein
MAADLEDEYYSFDATVLPDGVYRFRLLAGDGEDNAHGGALRAEQVSEPVVVDHSPPKLAGLRREGHGWRVEVEDDLSPLRQAEVSVDGGEWRPSQPEDGLLDGHRERLAVERPEAARLVLLRLTDAAHNVVTYDLARGAP